MDDFAHALQAYREGERSREELLGYIDRILAQDHDNAIRMLATLNEKNPKKGLSSELLETIQHRITLVTQDRDVKPINQGDSDDTVIDIESDLYSLQSPADADARRPTKLTRLRNSSPKVNENSIKVGGDILSNRFELVAYIGSGGMSTVYKAIDRHRLRMDDANPYVAVKIFNPKLSAQKQWLSALKQEATRWRELEHPNVIKLIDIHQDGSTVYLSMEYLAGESLRTILDSPGFRGMPAERALQIVNAMGQALTFAHDQDIVHCDFKPANVFITHGGEVKVIDFGIARAFYPGTEANAPPGFIRAITPIYASPEILSHGEPDPRDDIYALACTTYELLTGRHPFDRKWATEARDAKIPLVKPKALNRRQWQALQRALAFDRANRTPTVARFLAEISAAKRISWPTTVAIAASILMVALAVRYYLSVLDTTIDEPRTPVISKSDPQERVPLPDQPTERPNKTVESKAAQQSVIPLTRTPQGQESPTQDEAAPSMLHEHSQDVTATSTETASAQQITDLLEIAEQQMAAELLTTPAGDNAFETYQRILQIAPNDEQALKGIDRIKTRYQRWADTAIQEADWTHAQLFLDRALSVAPEDGALLEALRHVKETKSSAQGDAVNTEMESLQTAEISPEGISLSSTHDMPGISKEPSPSTEVSLPLVVQIERAFHNLVEGKTPGTVSIHARITGPVTQADVFVATQRGFIPYAMYDDGSHGDRTPDDSEYGRTLMLEDLSRGTRYYIAAYTAQGTAIYSPVRAETETYVIKPQFDRPNSPVVINEFMAKNGQTISDPQGDYEDWIELHNVTPEAIDLAGYYLSDDPNALKKWRFPEGTALPAHGYLLIWTDREPSYTSVTNRRAELHTNFKLSDRGERILLIDKDENGNAILDSVSFGHQGEDFSMRRSPNGVGKFGITRNPTPGWPN